MDDKSDFKPIPTKGSRNMHCKEISEFRAVVFEEPIFSKETKIIVNNAQQAVINKCPNKSLQTIGNKKENPEFNIRSVRNEVLNFAMSNQRLTKNRKKMEVFQAIKLGAKAPPKAYKNYKELLDERKRLKQIRQERKKFHQLGKNQTGAASVKCRSRSKLETQKKRATVTGIDKHYGVAKPKLRKNRL